MDCSISSKIGEGEMKKRFNLVMESSTLSRLEVIAKSQGEAVVSIVRRFINLGFLVYEASNDPETAVIIRKDGREREIMFW